MHVLKCSTQFSVLRCGFKVFWMVTRVLLSVVKVLEVTFFQLLCSFINILRGCQGIAMQLLSVQIILECCYEVSKVFWVVASELLCSCKGFLNILECFKRSFKDIMGGYQGIAMQLIMRCKHFRVLLCGF